MSILSRVALFIFLSIATGTTGIFSANFIFAAEKIDINTADSAELQKIHGIGPVIAGRIIEMRENCYFYPLSSLIEIEGIGEITLSEIEKEGKAFAQPPQNTKNIVLCQDLKEKEGGQNENEPKQGEDGPEEKENEEAEPLKIDINTASPKELQKLTGVGVVFAQKIIEARPFYSLDELTKVSGIGSKTLENIRTQGLAWIDPKLEPPKAEKEADSPETGLAALAETVKASGYAQSDKSPKNLSVFLAALSLAIFSGITILILRKKLRSKQ